MYPYTKLLSLTLVIALIASTLGCAQSTAGSNRLVSNAIPASSASATDDMLAEVSQDVGQITHMSSGKPQIWCSRRDTLPS